MYSLSFTLLSNLSRGLSKIIILCPRINITTEWREHNINIGNGTQWKHAILIECERNEWIRL